MSRTQPPGPRDGLTFVSQSPAELISNLRKQKGKDIWLMGGGELAREFLKDDLVDEIYLGIVPTLLGEGIPLFPTGLRKFELLEKQDLLERTDRAQISATACEEEKVKTLHAGVSTAAADIALRNGLALALRLQRLHNLVGTAHSPHPRKNIFDSEVMRFVIQTRHGIFSED
jgi:hypothetical protein